MDEQDHAMESFDLAERTDIARFTDSYASFNRIVNSLQRKYLEIKDEFAAQNQALAEANRKLAGANERALAANDFLFRILNSITAGVIAVDTDGRITHFNPAAARMMGIPASAAVGKLYRDTVPPGDAVDANALRTCESCHPVTGVEKVLELVDGTRLHLSVSTVVLRDDDNHPTGAIEVFHDLTKMKQMEQELARLNTLAALGEMAATIAHEVRNPLTGISGFAALLSRDLEEDDPRQQLVTKISRGVESLNQTVTSLLNYTKFDELSTETLDFEEFLRRTIEQFKYDQPDMARGSRFDYRSPFGPSSEPIQVTCDPMLIRQLVYNLFINAVEATDDGARVEIMTRKLPRQKATGEYGSRLILSIDETVVETTIKDFGPGLSDEAQASLFAPFFTTKPEGNGLGLAMAWKIIKAHGGDIIADNHEAGGARFRIVLPTPIVPSSAVNHWAE